MVEIELSIGKELIMEDKTIDKYRRKLKLQ